MNMMKRLEALERMNPHNSLSLEQKISQEALQKLTDHDLAILQTLQQKLRSNSAHVPTDEEADAMLEYIYHRDETALQESKASHAN